MGTLQTGGLLQPQDASLAPPKLFASFWMAGFESACHVNSGKSRLDMIAALQHDRQAATDYALLHTVGMKTARDGVRWHLIERAGQYDFSSLAPLAKAAQQHGIQVIWNLCHYGWPDDLDIFAPAFVDRFAKFCGAVVRFLREQSDDVPFYAPMNEISFFAWAACRDLLFPYAHSRDNELKRQLVRTAIAACEATWAVDRRARLVFPEPVIHIVAPRNRPDLAAEAASYTASMFEAWDMLAGRLQPDLGGHPKYLDIAGVNFYSANQWEHMSGPLHWDNGSSDDRWRPFSQILAETYRRYRRPIFIAETSHIGVGRGAWITEIANEVYQARLDGVPVEGICLYPILDRFDWDNPDHWHNSGLWDLKLDEHNCLRRVINVEYARALESCQKKLAEIGCV